MVTLTKIVCDFCSADVREAWFFAHGAFKFQSPMGLVDAALGEVAACTHCRPFVERRDAEGLSDYTFRASPEMASAAPVLRVFHSLVLRHLTGAVRHAKLGDSEAPPDRFFECACPRCGKSVVFDRAAAKDQSIDIRCPGCGADWRVGPIGHAT